MQRKYLTEWKKYLNENTSDNVKIVDLSKDGVIKYEVSSLDKTALKSSIDDLKQKHPDLKMRVVASSISPDKRITKTIIFVDNKFNKFS